MSVWKTLLEAKGFHGGWVSRKLEGNEKRGTLSRRFHAPLMIRTLLVGSLLATLMVIPATGSVGVLAWDYEHNYTYDWSAYTLTSNSVTGTIDFALTCSLGWRLASSSGSSPSTPTSLTIKGAEAAVEFAVVVTDGTTTGTLTYDCPSGGSSEEYTDGYAAVVDIPHGDSGSNQCTMDYIGNELECDFTCDYSPLTQTLLSTVDAIGIVGTATVDCAAFGSSSCSIPRVVGAVVMCGAYVINGLYFFQDGDCKRSAITLLYVKCDGHVVPG